MVKNIFLFKKNEMSNKDLSDVTVTDEFTWTKKNLL